VDLVVTPMPAHSPRTVRAGKRSASELQGSHSQSYSRIQELLDDEHAFRSCDDQIAFESSTQSYQLSLWRDRVAKWFYDVVDHLNVPRDTVYLAMNFLDRAVAVTTTDRLVTKEEYELTSTTCLFLALRVTTGAELRIADLLQMSHSRLHVKDVQATGSRLLHKLSLKIPMISPSTFARCYLKLIGSGVSTESSLALLEMACYLVELSVCDHFFTFVPPSKLAFAAVSVCITIEQTGMSIDPATRMAFMENLQGDTNLCLESPEIKPIFERLLAIYKQSSDFVASETPNVIVDDSESSGISPTPESTESLISLLPWTPSVVNLAGIGKRHDKRPRLL